MERQFQISCNYYPAADGIDMLLEGNKMNYFRCDECGRFISYEDLDSGKATHYMILPDSAYTTEIWATYCKEHNQKIQESL